MADSLIEKLQERRRAPRFLGLYEAEYSSFNNLVEIHSKVLIRNISALGASLPVNASIRKGQRLFLKIIPPYENKPVYLQGVVVWKSADLTAQREEYCGIKFLKLNKEDSKQILSHALKPQPIPA